MLGMRCNMKSGTILLCEPSFIIHAWVKLFFLQKFILVTNDELKHFINLSLALK